MPEMPEVSESLSPNELEVPVVPEMPVAPVIRRAGVADIPVLADLCAAHAAFEQAGFDATHFTAGIAAALLPPPQYAGEITTEQEGQGERCRADPAFASPWPRLLVYLLFCGKEAAGYLALSREFSTWRASDYLHMDCLFVRQAYRGRGLGRRLFNVALEEVREQGLERLEWQTPDWNDPAIRFYRELGARGKNKVRFSISQAPVSP
ncbi:GNAT family N-acetyltransferase [Kiloniella laminariae]|uniref:GNAT family N-acetyltransferase n=1 Tax=Kiloniella laminariae TaxID=454162 RepID=A0ABT4LFT6_9PROT|nr:GNAT family N-acetyltransferase [Kiloniella laminariae]MCZ4279971.1 GNAT family N-acetyltransferase [Kiloniella laminariae]